MDITQHLRVISRWRRVIIASALLGIALAALFTVKYSDGGLQWRHSAKWESTSRLFVTQNGFPWGRTTFDLASGVKATGGATGASSGTSTDGRPVNGSPSTAPNDFADPNRLSLLAIIYSFISQSNALSEINPKPLGPGEEIAAQELSNQNTGALPLFQLTATAPTRKAADDLNTERTRALIGYLATQQDVNAVPAGQRVKISVLNKPLATQVSGHGQMLGIAMIFLVMCAGLAASYMLESLRLSRERMAAGASGSGELVEHPTRGGTAEPQQRSMG
ncbi:hypothetical protein FSW04_22585 [Baekduia soli]|uniref:Capsular polysaccharide biosynthesis protein n=1 Tax=Baekduia soli TaxID=496014 RepID=A0A5B8UA65_9ACTN|nr:hypothetical protein [Baekduia soli]QEC50083.1 hypothetical protein FSW04_22585 [Baekduia soli]